jgi:ligand-binding sensor domain-containing protein
MRRHLTYLVLSTVVLLNGVAQAQLALQKTKFSRIEVTEGLSNSNVTCILQDRKGFIWVGTGDGLNKYDGYTFKIYRHNPEDTLSLLKNSINSLYEDRHGNLWVLTGGGGVHYYDRKLDVFRRLPEFTFGCDIIRLVEDSQNNLWLTGTRLRFAFIAKLDPLTKKTVHYNLFTSAEPVVGMAEAGANEFWIGVRRRGLFKWNAATNSIQRFPAGEVNSVVDDDIVKIIRDDAGNVWMATRNGLSKYDHRAQRFINFKNIPGNKNSLPVNTVRDLCADNNFIWLATENGGLARLNATDHTFSIYQNVKNDPTSLSDNSVWTVYKDHQGRIWVGTFSKGLCVIDNLKDKFQELDVTFENDIVNAIWQDHKKRLWIGTEGGLVMKDKDKVKYYKHDPSDSRSLSSNPVLSIYQDSKKRLWFGTWDGGINRYVEEQDNFVHYTTDKNVAGSLSDPNVYSISEYPETGALLVSSYRGLNVMVDENLGRFRNYVDEVQESNNYLRQVFVDTRGDLWLGSISELNRFHLDEGKRERFYYHNDSTTFDAMTNCIMEDKAGKVWIGTNNGLHLMGQNKFTASYTVKDGLPNNIVTGVLEADDGTLWLSTTKGLSEFDPVSRSFQNYYVSDGLLSDEFKPNACFRNEEGLLFFGGKGVILFDPSRIKRNPHIPPVYLTDLKIFNRTVKIGERDSLLRCHIGEATEISLPEKLNFFSIEFVALNFSASGKNKYAYRLDGFNDDWIYLEKEHFATFTNLDPGTYVFHVKASNNDGVWNEEGAQLIINILPRWYKTWWARVALVMIIVGAVILLYNIRMRRINMLNIRLETTVNERTQQLQRANDELKSREEQISAQNERLIEQREELAAQNEELVQQREELATQNEALVESKRHQLDLYTQKIVEKSEIINRITGELELLRGKGTGEPESVQKFSQILQSHILTEDDWERFKTTFNEVYPNFFASLRFRFPDITTAELRLAALIKMNLSLKEASAMLGISSESVKKSRYRLRKKLALQEEESLEDFIKKTF